MAGGIRTDDNAYCPTIARAYAESTGQAVTGAIFWNPYSSLGARYAHNGAYAGETALASMPAGDFVVVSAASWRNTGGGTSEVWLRNRRIVRVKDKSDYSSREDERCTGQEFV